MEIIALSYKYSMSLDDVVKLTWPQLKLFEENLILISKAESGEKSKEDQFKANEIAFDQNINMLKKETGRDKFTLQEINNPLETIKKHREKKK